MRKLPVFATAGRAYKFLFKEFGTILRLTWMPLLLLALIQLFISLAQDRHPIDLNLSAVAARSLTPSGLLLAVVNILVYLSGTAIAAVVLHRVILFAERMPGRLFHLNFGRTEWLFVAFPLVVWIIISIPFWLIMWSGALNTDIREMEPSKLMLFGLGDLILFAIAVYFLMRLSLLFPIAVVERKYDFGKAWELTRSNFWRLFGLWLLVMLPVYLVNSRVQNRIIFGSWFLPDITEISKTPIDATTLIEVSAAQYVFLVVLGALGVANLSYSYKALSGHGPDEILAPQAE